MFYRGLKIVDYYKSSASELRIGSVSIIYMVYLKHLAASFHGLLFGLFREFKLLTHLKQDCGGKEDSNSFLQQLLLISSTSFLLPFEIILCCNTALFVSKLTMTKNIDVLSHPLPRFLQQSPNWSSYFQVISLKPTFYNRSQNDGSKMHI